MKKDIVFMSLGGGQRIGASCYYLKIGSNHIILDTGTGSLSGAIFEPDFYSLLTSPYLESFGMISHVFISHAHSDHVAYLPKLMTEAKYATVYMTTATKALSEFLLLDRVAITSNENNSGKMLAVEGLLEKVTTVSYMQKLILGNCTATIYQAGHIPGAMMVLFEYKNRKILYTGDYSITDTTLTPGCVLPQDLHPDTVIMCGLHSKHPDYAKNDDSLFESAKNVLSLAASGARVRCPVSQLTKGIEFLSVLNSMNESYNIPIYVDDGVMRLIERMESLSVPIWGMNNRLFKRRVREPHILLSTGTARIISADYVTVNVDFSLHEDFDEMKEFIERLNPKLAVVVHSAPAKNTDDLTIEQHVIMNGDCRTQFLFPRDGEIHLI